MADTMHKSQFKFLDEVGEKHWWYKSKNDLVKMFLGRFLNGISGKRVLDIGCGAGNLSKELADTGYTVTSLDSSEEAINYCRARGLRDVHVADASKLPFDGSIFDGAVASEILEHIKDDSAAIAELYRVLKPGGIVVITVPALPFLFGNQDIYWNHFRRYTKSSLRGLIASSKFEILKLTYSNFSLFLPASVFRILQNLFGGKQNTEVCDEYRFNNALLSSFFSFVLGAEKIYLSKFNFPIGLSLLAVIKKK